MTNVKCKSFKDKDLDRLDERINKFLQEEGVTDVTYVAAHEAPRSSLLAVMIFYKVGEPEKVSKPRKPRKPSVVNEDKETPKIEVI